MKIKYYNELDGVRGIAAFMVMLLHFSYFIKDPRVFKLISSFSFLGEFGVTLFFVLSGFLITRILLSSKENNNYFSNFYIRRALRIFPLYYLFLILMYLVYPIISSVAFVPFGQQICYWIYLQNFAISFKWQEIGPGHFWSLAVEEHFYFFWPILVFYLAKTNIRKSVYAICILAFLLRVVLSSKGIDVYYNTFTRIDSLAMGALLAIIELENKMNVGIKKQFLSGFFISLIVTLVLGYLTSGERNIAMQSIKYVLINAVCYTFIGYIISAGADNFLSKILKTGPFKYTGKISYGLYIYHPFCFDFLAAHFKLYGRYLILDFILSFLFCYLVATASYYLFEIRFLKLKKKFKYEELVPAPEII